MGLENLALWTKSRVMRRYVVARLRQVVPKLPDLAGLDLIVFGNQIKEPLLWQPSQALGVFVGYDGKIRPDNLY